MIQKYTRLSVSFLLLMTIALFGFAQVPTARYQVIHNAADVNAQQVDVWFSVGGGASSKLIDDFTFRTATPFADIPAGVPISIGIAPATSTTANDTIANFDFTLVAGETYVIVANGLLSQTGYTPNPDGIATGFELLVTNNVRETAANAADVDFIVVHGATDAPTIDARLQGATPPPLVNDKSYRDITGYVSAPPALIPLEITNNTGEVVVGTYAVDLTGLAGGSAVVFASGFLDSTMNSNGRAFQLCYALADGTTGVFPASTTARLQVVHNSPDPAAATVDVWVSVDGVPGTAPFLDNLNFREGTQFVDVPSGAVLSIGIAPGNSTMISDTIANFDVTLAANQKYIAIANGVLSPASFAVNPDGRSTAFNLEVKTDARESALDLGRTDFFVFHGAPDAPTVDVRVAGSMPPPLVDDASFTDATGYLFAPPASLDLEITDATGAVVVATHNVDLTTLDGQSAMIFASGFLDPTVNMNGEPFSLCYITGNGTTGCFNPVVSVEEGLTVQALEVYPSPATDFVNISYDLPTTEDVTVEILDQTGRTVALQPQGLQVAGMHKTQIETRNLASGLYMARVTAGEQAQMIKVIISR